MASSILKTGASLTLAVAVVWYLLIPRKVSATSAWMKVLYMQTLKSSNLRYILIASIVLSLSLRRLSAGQAGKYKKYSFATSFFIVSYAYYKLFIVEHAKSRFQRTLFNVQVAERAGLTQEVFRPTPWAFAAPGQTISCLAVSAMFERLLTRPLVFHRDVVTKTFDGNSQFLDWVRFESEEADRAAFSEYRQLRSDAKRKWTDEAQIDSQVNSDEEDEEITPIILLIHGFGESRHHPPLQRFARRARELGWRAVVWSYWRFDFGEVRDLRDIVEHIRAGNPCSPIIAVGFSAGGYLLMRYLEEYGEDTGLSCAVGLSPLQDPITAINLTKETQNRVYSLYLNHLAKVAARRHIRADQSLTAVRKSLEYLIMHTTDGFELYDRFLFELPGGFSRRSYEGAAVRPAYSFRGPTLSHYRPTSADIHKVKLPTLVVHANDDPIVAGHIHDWGEMVRRNKHLIVVTTQRGGHEGHYDGFIPGGSTWDMRVAIRFISAVLETQAQMRHVEYLVDRKLLAGGVNVQPSSSFRHSVATSGDANTPFRSTQSFATLPRNRA